MAEGGDRKYEQGQDIRTGSEFVFDFYCELCRDNGLNEEADGYCNDCREYLCNICIRAHLRSRPSRHHDVLDQSSMPKDKPLTQDRISKDISTKCQYHSNKMVEYYCPTHDALGCTTCFVTVHKKCDVTESVYDKSDNILDGKEYDDFTKTLADMKQRSSDMLATTGDNISSTTKSCSNTIHDIRKLKKECIAIFDELEQALIVQVNAMASADQTNLKRIEKELEGMTKAVDDLRTEFDNLVKSKRVCQLYIRMKERKSEVSSLGDKLRTAAKRVKGRSFAFIPNDDIKNAIRTTGIGKILHKDTTPDKQNITLAKNDNNTRATHLSDIDVRASSDAYDCDINGSAVLSDTMLVVADYKNNKVKLVDTKSHKLKSELSVSDPPFDVAKINNNLVAVSITGVGKIFIIKVTDTLTLEREISLMSSDCRGIAYSQDRLFVTYFDQRRIDVLDLYGNVIKKLTKNKDGGSIFNNPRHVCVSTDGQSVYVSDYSKTVRRLALDGENISTYCEISAWFPQKVCTDHCGYVYIAAHNKKCVHMVTSDLVKIKEVLTKADGLDKNVVSVSHCASTNRLYVGMDGSNVIKVYQLA